MALQNWKFHSFILGIEKKNFGIFASTYEISKDQNYYPISKVLYLVLEHCHFFLVIFTSRPLWIWYRMSVSEKRVSSHNWKRSSVLLGLVISYCWWLLFIMAQELSRKCFTNDPHLSTVCLINWFGVTPSTIGKTTLSIAMTTLLANILWWLHTGLKKILCQKNW